MQNDWIIYADVMDQRDFARFEFKMSCGWISHIFAQHPSTSLYIDIPWKWNYFQQLLARRSKCSHPLSSCTHLWRHAWWRNRMETFSALLALCAGNSSVTGEFPSQRPMTQSFDVFFDLRLNKRLSKQSSGWWFETPSRQLWHHCNDMILADQGGSY